MTVNNDAPGGAKTNETDIVRWEDQLKTGIQLIDAQHMELVNLTNQLFQACRGGSQTAGTAFSEAMHRMVEYIRFHFTTELGMLQRINYPNFQEHKQQHETLIKEVLTAVKDFNEGKKFVPNNFVRTLRDWVFGHIAVADKNYTLFIASQKKQGLLTDAQING